VLFGGASDVTYNDTWEWDGIIWQNISVTNAPPPLRVVGMVYDEASAQSVLLLDGLVYAWKRGLLRWV